MVSASSLLLYINNGRFGGLSLEQRIKAVTTRNCCLAYMLRYLFAKMEKEGHGGEFAFDDEILNMFHHFQNAMKQMNPPFEPPPTGLGGLPPDDLNGA